MFQCIITFLPPTVPNILLRHVSNSGILSVLVLFGDVMSIISEHMDSRHDISCSLNIFGIVIMNTAVCLKIIYIHLIVMKGMQQ